MAITREQFNELRSRGLTVNQIAAFENGVKPTASQIPTEKTSGALGVISRFTGIDALGRGLGKVAFNFTKEKKELDKLLSEGRVSPEEYQNITTGGLTNKQVLGSAAQTALTVGTLGIPASGAATAGGRIASTAATGAALGAAGGGISAFEQGGGGKDIVRNAIFGGVIGGVLGGATKAAGEGVKALTKNAPGALYNTAIKTDLNDTKKALRYNGETLGDELIKRGVTGSDKKLYSTATTRLAQSEEKLQNILKGSSQTINRDDLAPYMDDLIEKYRNTPGLGPEITNLKEILNEMPEKFTLEQANVFKRNIYDALTDTAFRLDPSLSPKRTVMKALAKGLKQEIEDRSSIEFGLDTVKNINKDLSVYGRLQDKMIDKIARANRNNFIGLSDYATLGTGALAGMATGGSATVGALGLEAVKKATGSTIFKTNAAVKLNNLGKLIDKLPTDGAGKISKTALFNLINSTFDAKR